MNLKYVQGDLIQAALDGHLNVIAHQANCFCKGRRGIAPLIFQTFPVAKAADDATEVGDKEKLGSLSHAYQTFKEDSIKNPVWVFNLYGQYHFDNRREDYGTQYWALNSALHDMRYIIEAHESMTFKIGFPLIGCGLAGGDWSIVEEMIENQFRDIPNAEIYIYTLNDKLKDKEYVEVESIG